MTILLKSRVLLACVGISALLLFAALVAVIASIGSLSSPVVFHMNADGADLFGSPSGLVWLWLLGLAMVTVNSLLGLRFFESVRSLTYALFGANVVVGILLLIAIGTIVSLN